MHLPTSRPGGCGVAAHSSSSAAVFESCEVFSFLPDFSAGSGDIDTLQGTEIIVEAHRINATEDSLPLRYCFRFGHCCV